jgi:hypothetical protein
MDMEPDRVLQVEPIPACAVLSPAARVVLGCLEILADPSLDGLVEVTGFSTGEVRRCISELNAVSRASGEPT